MLNIHTEKRIEEYEHPVVLIGPPMFELTEKEKVIIDKKLLHTGIHVEDFNLIDISSFQIKGRLNVEYNDNI